jgi:23S rRNA pseudouridine1911/1915/1917 synthase
VGIEADNDGAQTGATFAVAEAEAGARLDRVLAARLGVGRAAVRALLARGSVRLDARALGYRDKARSVEAGARIEVAGFAAPDARCVRPEPEAPLVVRAEGPGWVAIDKPAGQPVHPLREDEGGTLLNALIARRPELSGVGEGGLRSGVVHRLDVDTSGVLLVATEQTAWLRLRTAFREHRIDKRYRAIVVGRLAGEGALEVDLTVARHRPARVAVVGDGVGPVRAGARRTVLRWQALAHGDGVTLVEVRPRTGFLHQIRATLAWLGHPVCGDRSYGTPDDDPTGAARQLLHAASLRFEEIRAASPDPADFAAVGQRVGLDPSAAPAPGEKRGRIEPGPMFDGE